MRQYPIKQARLELSMRYHKAKQFVSRRTAVVFVIIAILGIAFLVVPQQAQAATYADLGMCPGIPLTGLNFCKMVLDAVELIMKGFEWIARMFLQITSRFFKLILIDFTTAVGFYKNELVRVGWAAVRDVANWFFIVALLYIAFSIILDLPGPGKRLLPTLIIVALLINFSLFLTALVVNVSQLFMSFFTNAISGQYADIGNVLAQGMQIGKFTESPEAFLKTDIVGDNELGDLDKDLMQIFNYSAGVIFEGVGAIVFLILALLMVIRVVVIWVLLILSPLVFIAALFPMLSGFKNTWLKQFITWNTFGILTAFFIWLATYLLKYMTSEEGLASFAEDFRLVQGSGLIAAMFVYGKWFLQYITTIVFLIMGTMIALSMASEVGRTVAPAIGGMLAGAAMMAAGARGFGRAGALVGKAAKPLVPARARAYMRTTMPSQVGRFLSRIPIVGAPAGAALMRYAATERKRFDQAQGDIEKRRHTPEELARLYHTEGRTEYKAAYGAALAKTGKFTQLLSPASQRQALMLAKQHGAEKEILRVKPEMATLIGAQIAAAVRQIFAREAHLISAESLGHQEVVVNISRPQLRDIGMNSTEEQREAFRHGIDKAIDNIPQLSPTQQARLNEVVDYLATAPEW